MEFLKTGGPLMGRVVGAGILGASIGYMGGRITTQKNIRVLKTKNKELSTMLDKNAQYHYVVLQNHDKVLK